MPVAFTQRAHRVRPIGTYEQQRRPADVRTIPAPVHHDTGIRPRPEQRAIQRLRVRIWPGEAATGVRPAGQSLRGRYRGQGCTSDTRLEQATKQCGRTPKPTLITQTAHAAVEHKIRTLLRTDLHGYRRQ